MYIPPKFRVDDVGVMKDFIRKNPFGLILTAADGEIHDTHTPFIFSRDGKSLLGHIAKANPQWKKWKEITKGKVIFSGPHTYISPSYYSTDFNVPTWNYTAVSISGEVKIIEEEHQVIEFLDCLVAENEMSDSPWKLDQCDERYMKLLSAIVVFSVSLDKIEASFKLNQNKSVEDQQSVIKALSQSGCPFDREVSELMRNNQEKAEQGGAGQCH